MKLLSSSPVPSATARWVQTEPSRRCDELQTASRERDRLFGVGAHPVHAGVHLQVHVDLAAGGARRADALRRHADLAADSAAAIPALV